MRHVTDGELHAYLDGGLDNFADDRATEVRRHVDRCERCASRLEEAREIRARADEILGMAAPDVAGAPSLEELRRLAAAPEATGATTEDGPAIASGGTGLDDRPVRSDGPRGRSSLRWAATVLVALGAGWLWGIAGGPGTTPAGSPPGERSVSPGDATVEDVQGPAAADRMSAAAGSPEASSSRGPEPVERRARTVADARSASRPAEIPVASPRPRMDSLAAASPARAEELGSIAPGEAAARVSDEAVAAEPRASGEPSLADRLAVGWTPLTDAVSTGTRGVALPDSVTALRSADGAADVGTDAVRMRQGWPSVDRGDREGRPAPEVLGLRHELSGALDGARMRVDMDGPAPVDALERARATTGAGIDPGSLTVPGLDVVSVEWTRVAPETTGIRVVQRLVTGGTIELRFGGLTDGSGAPEYLREERLPEGLQQVVADFRDGWLVARAPLEPDQIRALVALIR